MNPSHMAARHDPYRHIHKGLRAFMFDTLHRIGRMDAGDAAELRSALDQADRLLTFMAAHVKHENEHMHTAIEAGTPGGARHTADDHGDHIESLAALREQVAALRNADAAARDALAHRLYLDLAEFTAENLSHMRVEETHNNQQLWTLYSDAELEAIHDRLLASVEPPTMMEAVTWMARSLSVPELAGMLADAKAKVPAPAFEAALETARRQVEPARWLRVKDALAQ